MIGASSRRSPCATLADAVYVLHGFQNKRQQASEKDIRLARKRFKDLMKEQP